jgi:hypothetical protein
LPTVQRPKVNFIFGSGAYADMIRFLESDFQI